MEASSIHDRENGYLVACMASIAFGYVHRMIRGDLMRRWSATIVGLIAIAALMGVHAWHLVAMAVVVAATIRMVPWRIRHLVAGAQSMLYLVVFRIYTAEDRESLVHVALVQMMVVAKLVGVAFETRNNHSENKERKPYPDENCPSLEPGVVEILHYTFCYVGILVGPYVRYRTYKDFIELPFSRIAHDRELLKKFVYFPVNMFLFLVIVANWPIKYIFTEEFDSRSLLYRTTYAAIQYQMFKQWMYCGLLLSEITCSTAGFGAYPVQAESKYTHGPTKDYDRIRTINAKEAATMEYDFATNSCIDIYVMQTCPWVTKYTMEWNKSIQYFMGMYVYKATPRTGLLKPFRILITILVCSLWHGLAAGYHVGMIVMPMYVPTERLYLKIYERLSGWKSAMLACLMYVVQYYFIGFGVLAFLIVSWDKVIDYYVKVRFSPYIFLLCLHLLGLAVLRRQRTRP